MSTPITATHTDPRVNTIKATVRSKKDNIPFLLLPVRLETRFMKVEKPKFSHIPGQFEHLLEQFGNVNVGLVQERKLRTSTQMRSASIKLIRQLRNLTKTLKTTEKLEAQDIHWLKQQEAITQEEGKKMIAQVARQRSLGKIISRELKSLNTQINTIQKTKDNTYIEGSRFIAKLRYFHKKWAAIGSKNTPYSNPKRKKTTIRLPYQKF